MAINANILPDWKEFQGKSKTQNIPTVQRITILNEHDLEISNFDFICEWKKWTKKLKIYNFFNKFTKTKSTWTKTVNIAWNECTSVIENVYEPVMRIMPFKKRKKNWKDF